MLVTILCTHKPSICDLDIDRWIFEDGLWGSNWPVCNTACMYNLVGSGIDPAGCSFIVIYVIYLTTFVNHTIVLCQCHSCLKKLRNCHITEVINIDIHLRNICDWFKMHDCILPVSVCCELWRIWVCASHPWNGIARVWRRFSLGCQRSLLDITHTQWNCAMSPSSGDSGHDGLSIMINLSNC